MAGFTLLQKTVTTSGTRVALSATPLKFVSALVQVKENNTGKIFVGDDTVVATAGGKHIVLEIPQATVTPPSIRIDSPNDYDLADLADIFIDAGVNGEGVNIFLWR